MTTMLPAFSLEGKTALVTGASRGIGFTLAQGLAQAGATVIAAGRDADTLDEAVGRLKRWDAGATGLVLDVARNESIQRAFAWFDDKPLDILINNAAEQHPQDTIENITSEQLERTFRTNIFSMFYLTKAAMPHLKAGSTIINTTSITAYRGSPKLLDYSSTKGAILSFTRSLSANLAEKGIRVNAVAPGPIWTPLIPSTMPEDKIGSFGKKVALGRPGQPAELAGAYVLLASGLGSYMTGAIVPVTGGSIMI